MGLNALQADADKSYFPNQFQFRQGFDHSNLSDSK